MGGGEGAGREQVTSSVLVSFIHFNISPTRSHHHQHHVLLMMVYYYLIVVWKKNCNVGERERDNN